MLDEFCVKVAAALREEADPELGEVVDEEMCRVLGRTLFNTRGRPAPHLANLRRSMFLDSDRAGEWESVCVDWSDGWTPGDPGALHRLVVHELTMRLGNVKRTSLTASRLQAAAAAALKRLPSPGRGSSHLSPAVQFRRRICGYAWREFISAAYFTSTPLLDEQGKLVRWRLAPECRRELAALGLSTDDARSLFSRSGGIVAFGELVDFREGPARVLAVAVAVGLPSAPGGVGIWDETKDETTSEGLETTTESLERQLDREAELDEGQRILEEARMEVAEVAAKLVEIADRIHAQVTARSRRWGDILSAMCTNPDEQRAEFIAINEDVSSTRTQAAKTRATTARRMLLAPKGVVRARSLVGEDDQYFGARHVLPSCLEKVCPRRSSEIVALRALEGELSAALASLPTEPDDAFALLDPLLREIHGSRRALRSALADQAVRALHERGLVDEPERMPQQLWRLEAAGQHAEDRLPPLAHAAQPGRVILAPTSVVHVWDLDSGVLERVPDERAEYLRAMLEDIAAGEWRYFVDGDVDV